MTRSRGHCVQGPSLRPLTLTGGGKVKKKKSLFSDPNRLFPFGDACLLPGMVLIERVGTRPPRKGELYLSGAIPTVYRAPTDNIKQTHLIVRAFKPGPKKVIIYDKGEEII